MRLMRPRFFLFLFLLFSLFLLNPDRSFAQDATEVELEVEAGFGGYYTVNHWFPVHVTATNEGDSVEGFLEVEAGDNFVEESTIYRSPISLPTGSHKRVTLYIYIPDFNSGVTVRLVDAENNVVAQRRNPATSISVEENELLYGVVSSDPAVWTFLEDVAPNYPDASVGLVDVEDLPEMAPAWNGLDILVLHDVDTGQLSAAQLENLHSWLTQGGLLVVAGGSGWQATTAALANLLPVTVSGTQSIDDLPLLSNLTDEPFRDEGPYVVNTSELKSGELLLHQDGVPLLARRTVGRGDVYFLALDPALPPLKDWHGNEAFWAQIAARTPSMPLWAHGPRNSYDAVSAVNILPELSLPSAGYLFGFLIVYVIVVGPLNYVFLSRRGRRELAWITIPSIILFFALLTYVTGYRLRGSEVIFNQRSIAFGHVNGEQMRVHGVLGVYSPRRGRFDVVLPGTALVRPYDNDFNSFSSGGSATILQGREVMIEDTLIDVSAVESYSVETYRELPPITGHAMLTIEERGAALEVTVQNNGDVALENAGFYYGKIFIPLDDVPPGDMITKRRNLTSVQANALTGSNPVVSYPGTVQDIFVPYSEHLLGASMPYSDSETRARSALLSSMEYSGGSTTGSLVSNTGVTLVGWTGERQFEPALSGSRMPIKHMSSTLYFLELPMERTVVNGENIRVPRTMLDTHVVGDSGIYYHGDSDIHMPRGWIEFEFQPWSAFDGMTVTELQIVLARGRTVGSGSSPAPELFMWDWEEESWAQIPDMPWGTVTLPNFEDYLGGQNQIRIRLENNTTSDMSIRHVYPRLTGDVQQ